MALKHLARDLRIIGETSKTSHEHDTTHLIAARAWPLIGGMEQVLGREVAKIKRFSKAVHRKERGSRDTRGEESPDFDHPFYYGLLFSRPRFRRTREPAGLLA